MSKPQGVDMRSAACFYQFFSDSLAIIIQFIRANILPICPFDGVAVCADAAEVSRVSQRAAPLPTRIFVSPLSKTTRRQKSSSGVTAVAVGRSIAIRSFTSQTPRTSSPETPASLRRPRPASRIPRRTRTVPSGRRCLPETSRSRMWTCSC